MTTPAPSATTAPARTPIRFNRRELAGAFGDIGTDLPLIVGMILAAGLDAASVLIAFGALQIATGLFYRMPMPVQPLKAVAALVIAQKLAPGTIYGAGLAIGVVMLALTLSGLIGWFARVVPPCVVRGIQFGLGVQLVLLSLRDFVRAEGGTGYALAGAAFVVVLLLREHGRFPGALVVIALGLVYAAINHWTAWLDAAATIGLHLPVWNAPAWSDIVTGFFVLSLPQIPLSLGNSILATRQVAADFIPERPLTVRRIGFTYSLMNLVAPWLSGIPVCHGSGGFAGHFAFGGRTGGSVVIYGGLFLVAGLFFSDSFAAWSRMFPLPVLGVLLLVEGWTLITLARDQAERKGDFMIAVLTGLLAGGLPYGYLVGIVVGTVLFYTARRGWVRIA